MFVIGNWKKIEILKKKFIKYDREKKYQPRRQPHSMRSESKWRFACKAIAQMKSASQLIDS